MTDQYIEALLKERKDAISARRQSGLDDIWAAARAQYHHGSSEGSKLLPEKSRTLDGPLVTALRDRPQQEKRSTVSVNITRPYTNAGTARVADILLPTGGKQNWDLRPTPVSELALLTSFVMEHPEILNTLPPDLQQRLQASEQVQQASIGQAKLLISDWLVETKWHNHTRKQIVEAGKVGTGVIKGPFPKMRQLSADTKAVMLGISLGVEDPQEARLLGEVLKMRMMFQPAVECIPVENLYPDMPSCGDDIHNGRFVWEKVPDISPSELQGYLNDSTYAADAIRRCLDEGPTHEDDKSRKKKSFTKWRRIGELDLSKIEGTEEEGIVWVELEIINDYIVKWSKPALDSHVFPYRILVWEPRPDSWAGIGIPEQIETPQRGLNASVRAGNDNMGWSVGFQVILGQGLEPAQGSDTEIEPYKLWRDITDSLAAMTGKERSAKDAIATIEFPNHLDKILAWIEFWLQMAESTTGLSLLMQGQKATDSVGVSQMLMNSSTTNLRMFVKHWDDDNCAPLIQDFYRWVQRYGPENAKGDAVAQALGSSVLIVRDLQQQMLVQMLDRFVQPVYGKSPAKGMDMVLEAAQFDPRQLDLDEEERQRLEAAASEPDPKVQVEQLRSETDKFIAQLKDAREEWKGLLDAQLKGESFDQAMDAVETQVAGSVVQEGMRQEGQAEQQAPQEAEPSLEESMRIVGL